MRPGFLYDRVLLQYQWRMTMRDFLETLLEAAVCAAFVIVFLAYAGAL